MNDPIYQQAMQRLRELMEEAGRRGDSDPRSCALATVDQTGQASVRIIDVLEINARGIVFFTDSTSGKAAHLRATPKAGLCWHWPQLRFQATLEGDAELLSDEEADACWRTRPREKNLSSWIAPQSSPITDRQQLHGGLRQVREQFAMVSVPRPPSWCAFRIVPKRIEIWRIGWQLPRAKLVYVRDADHHWTETSVTP